MSKNSNQPNYEQYWRIPTFSVLGVDQGYIIVEKIVTAKELLARWGSFEPYELALAINDDIVCQKTGAIRTFPPPFLLYKTRVDQAQRRTYHFLLPADFLFPFKYAWQNDTLTFDFTGIVFKEDDIRNIELCAVDNDFQLGHHENAPQPYRHSAFLRENFPVDGPDTLIASLMEKISVSSPITEEAIGPKKNMSKAKKDMRSANETRRENVEKRWKEQFSIGVVAAVFCLEQHRKTGKPVMQKEYRAALQKHGLASFMVEAEELFRKLMPPEVLHRGDRTLPPKTSLD